jgi:hypothetical protein
MFSKHHLLHPSHTAFLPVPQTFPPASHTRGLIPSHLPSSSLPCITYVAVTETGMCGPSVSHLYHRTASLIILVITQLWCACTLHQSDSADGEDSFPHSSARHQPAHHSCAAPGRHEPGKDACACVELLDSCIRKWITEQHSFALSEYEDATPAATSLSLFVSLRFSHMILASLPVRPTIPE